MSTFRLTASPVFPQGTTVGAYLVRTFAGGPPQPGDAPRAVTVATAVVDGFGFAELTGLVAGTPYYAGAQVAGTWRWINFSTPPTVGEQGEPGKEGKEGREGKEGPAGGVGARTAVAMGTGMANFTVTTTVRAENGGSVCRLEGNPKATSERAPSAVLLTIPEGFRPQHSVAFWGDVNGTVALCQIATSGTVTCAATIGSGQILTIPEGVTWALTEGVAAGASSAWQALTLEGTVHWPEFGAKPQARREGDSVRLAGAMATESSIPFGTAWAQVPATLRPQANVTYWVILSGEVVRLEVTTAGAVYLVNTTAASGKVMRLDGITYPLRDGSGV